MFLEYAARFTDKYVWITPQPHEFLLFFVITALMGLLTAIVPLSSRKRSGRWLLASFAFVIFEVPLPVVFSAQNSMYEYRSVTGAFVGYKVLDNFYEEKKRYPVSQQELDAFIPGQERYFQWSWYSRRGARLPYRYVYVANATGPYTPNPPGPDPATVYCAVSGDLQHYWTTGTDLRSAIGNEIVMSMDNGRLVVFDENAKKPSPSR